MNNKRQAQLFETSLVWYLWSPLVQSLFSSTHLSNCKPCSIDNDLPWIYPDTLSRGIECPSIHYRSLTVWTSGSSLSFSVDCLGSCCRIHYSFQTAPFTRFASYRYIHSFHRLIRESSNFITAIQFILSQSSRIWPRIKLFRLDHGPLDAIVSPSCRSAIRTTNLRFDS